MRLIIFIFRSITVLVIATIPFLTNAQDRCGTVEYMKTLQGDRFYENRLNFEQWMEQRTRVEKRQDLHRQQAIYQIPVVVHVIHNGEAIGTDKNISDAQILSQISVLNKDYNRLNTDAANTPAEYQSLAGSFEVEFVLAKQNPEGLATTGIVRVQGPKSSWSVNDNYELKSLSYWPAEDYLNIWVCNLSGLLGYAQFPVSNMPGLGNSSNNRLTDGIVVTYNAFGSEEDGDFKLLSKYKRGRTTTHEVGHFFGLRHIWGDDDGQCDGSDYVDDTPNQASSTSGCPTQPLSSCGTSSMYQNFLDYTDDACMNLITLGQVDRMTTVLENSPRRATLLTSHGLSDPIPAANDLGVREIISPLSGECNMLVTPVIDIRNYGSNSASSTQINVKVDDTLVETKNFDLSPALSPLESTTLSFSPTSLTGGLHTVTFEIVLTNTVSDGSVINNTLSQQVLIPETISLPVTENFNSLPSSWQIINPDGKTAWELTNAPNADPSNTAMKMDFYNYEDNLGEVDLFITPVFDLSSSPVALLLFDVAYARFNDDNDGLRVVVLSDCNADINQGTVVYEKSGVSLETRSPTTNEFIPVSESQWRNEFLDLSAFAGQNNLQLAFVGINDWGNNLYLDNVSIITTPLNDVALETIISPSPVLCSDQVNPRIRIKNIGTLLTSIKARAIINGQSAEVQTFSGLNLLGGNALELELSPISLATGANTVYIELSEPSGLPDVNPSNNSKTSYSVVNNASEEVPIRENFEEEFEDQWTIINPSGGMNWEEKRIGSNNSLFVNAYNNQVIEDKSWVVSPMLDFSATTAATLTFDLSYAYRGSANDQLLILASKDCGIAYTDTVFNASRIELANAVASSTSWEPVDSVWQRNKKINLTALAGEPEVRIAFVFINQNGNNIYLDNIEFFVTEDPTPIDNQMSVYPNPFNLREQGDSDPLRVTFNLPEKGPVLIEIIDVVGRILVSEMPPHVLNQTYMISVPDIPAGTYIVRATSETGVFIQRIIILK